ncbi:MAG: metallophosphoesterase, partial [Bacteroidales bacterium]|nr:metallophosphoesterase [Bacteroidales bacterium]
MISKGETIQIPLEGEWNLLYKGFKAGDKITITMVNDASVTFTLECTSADDVAGAVFTIPTKFIGGMCKVVAEAGGRTTTGTCFVEIVDTAEVEKKSGYTTYGRVVDYEAKPVAGVAVSDGALVTTTDSEGRYYLRSERKNVFVFISIPKNYRVAIDRAVPQFFQRFKSTRTSTYEQHNFVLAPEENVKHRVLVWSDTHLANRTDDANQFKKFFKPDIEQQIAKAKSEGVKLYAIGLGDLAWDEFWYKNDYSLKDYREDISDFDLTIFSSPGNHDNDPSIADDFLAAAGFRENLNPLYYSFNIGDIHYIMMDNTLFKNSGATSNNYNVQDYTEGFTDDQMKWLKGDLATVPEGTTIIFGLHIPWTNRSQSTGKFTYAMPATYRSEVESLLSKFTVHFISGHTHTNYTNIINSKMREHNI